MRRKVFFSFHFDNDFWRTQQVRNIGALEGQTTCSANAWEEIKRKGDAAVKKWISDNMTGKSCVVVLVGSDTANRRWVLHEISKGWNDGKGILAIRVNKLLDAHSQSSRAGPNPLSKIAFNDGGKTLADVVELKTPVGSDSKAIYATISNNIEKWIEEAIRIRANA
ncbi:TIR domain-containing protein [Tepidicaulis sp.]|uniref:TIR domain-containing protein n=1 Tax=Tepidicaulis sp. TaxID=1920809 RepID=UPI003B591C95